MLPQRFMDTACFEDRQQLRLLLESDLRVSSVEANVSVVLIWAVNAALEERALCSDLGDGRW